MECGREMAKAYCADFYFFYLHALISLIVVIASFLPMIAVCPVFMRSVRWSIARNSWFWSRIARAVAKCRIPSHNTTRNYSKSCSTKRWKTNWTIEKCWAPDHRPAEIRNEKNARKIESKLSANVACVYLTVTNDRKNVQVFKLNRITSSITTFRDSTERNTSRTTILKMDKKSSNCAFDIIIIEENILDFKSRRWIIVCMNRALSTSFGPSPR